MLLEFLDGSQLEVNEIFAGPKLVMGVMRDTLRIEIPPDKSTFNELLTKFKDVDNCRTLFTYTDDIDENGNPVVVKNTIGEGYCIFVSVTYEERLVRCSPGVLLPDKTESLYIVTIAQMTFNEYIDKYGELENFLRELENI